MAAEEENLVHYFSIIGGEALPNYLVLKTIPVEVELTAPSNVLREAHIEGIERFAIWKEENRDETSPNLLDIKIELARRMLKGCELCERRCRVNRSEGEKGTCGVLESRIASEFIHMGEEPVLVPSHTIFFSGCNFTCIYCQNWDISQNPKGGIHYSSEQINRIMQKRHALNTNWVGGDPTPNIPFILEALGKATIKRAQVWNSNMYLTREAMSLLERVMDLYLTDFKYGNNRCGEELSGVKEYFDVVSRNHLLIKGKDTIIRHLVLPGHLECCTRPILKWIKENRPDAVVNVMAQYHPDYKAHNYPGLNRHLSSQEFREAVRFAGELGLRRTG